LEPPILKNTENKLEKPTITTSEFQPLPTSSKENSAFMYARGAFSGPFEFPFHFQPLMTNDLYIPPPPPLNWNTQYTYQQQMYPAVNQERRFQPSQIRYPIPMWNDHAGMRTSTATASSEELQLNTPGPALLDISNCTPGVDTETGNLESTNMDTESNTSKIFSTSMNVIAGDSSNEECMSVPLNISATCRQEPGSECADCLRKDKEIADLKRQINDMQTAGNIYFIV
jgi:hypothetical protein